MHKVSVIVPVLNEAGILRDSLNALKQALSEAEAAQTDKNLSWEVVVSDAGSGDGSIDITAELCRSFSWKHIAESSEEKTESSKKKIGSSKKKTGPSVGKTVAQGLEVAEGESILILPADCSLRAEALLELQQAVSANSQACGGFEKCYVPSTLLLTFYQQLQNIIRFRILRNLVWTHGMFFPKSLLVEHPIPQVGFLEDVLFSDLLKQQTNWLALRGPIEVSSRRYYPNRKFKRIFINAVIMFLFRCRLASVAQLRKIYLGRK